MSYPIKGLPLDDNFDEAFPTDHSYPFHDARSLPIYEPLSKIKQNTIGLVREGGFDNPLLRQTLPQQINDHWPQLALFGFQIRRDLEEGKGFALVEGWPHFESFEERGLLFLSLAVFLGIPVPHDAHERGILWNISPDSHQDSYPTFSQNNHEAPLHTDGVYKLHPPDIVGLYMVSQASLGGETFWLDGYPLLKKMAKSKKGKTTLNHLEKPYPIRVPSAYGVDPHVAEYIKAPVLSISETEKQLRFRKDTLLAGAAEMGIEPDRLEALEDFLENLDEAPPSNYRLPNGSMLFLNNRRMLHGRTAFRGPRLAYRVWLRG